MQELEEANQQREADHINTALLAAQKAARDLENRDKVLKEQEAELEYHRQANQNLTRDIEEAAEKMR
jgi:hypothetical protein